MNLDKMVNSKWYSGFEWGYRLVFLNLLMITIPSLLGGIPFLIWYFNQSWGWLMIVAIVLMIFGFIPCYIATFRVIKAYKEEMTKNLFVLFFSYLFDTIKYIYVIELILLPILFLYTTSAFIYWEILGYFSELNLSGWFVTVGFVVVFFSLLAIFFAILQWPMIIGHFRMKPWSLVKFSFFMAFRSFFKTISYFLLLLFPLLLVNFLKQAILPIYLLIGISGPLFIMYIISRKQYWYLTHNLDDFTTEENLEG